MHLSKHRGHRNPKYLSWLRAKSCVVSGKKAQCAHHIRLGTNGGTSIKPSDYFCIPLLNEYHTTGPSALHLIGEETFLRNFGLNPRGLFSIFLRDFLFEVHEIIYTIGEKTPEEDIFELITLIESNTKRVSRSPSKKSLKTKAETPVKVSITENQFYQDAKKLKNERDKALRRKLKEQGSGPEKPKKQFKGNEYYEKAKEEKRVRDRELRQRSKELAAKHKKEQKEKLKESTNF